MKNNGTVLENLLVWSAHRSRTLSVCARRYYYNYIGSWEGWDDTSPPEVQAAYRLKHLTTPELEIGQIVHAQICLILEKARDGRTIHSGTEIRAAQNKFEAFVRQSEGRQLEEITAKKKRLFLHEMGESLTVSQLATYSEKIELYLTTFFAFPDGQSLLADPTVLIPELLDPAGFEIGNELGVPARPKTDAVFVTLDRVVICDWKCGDSVEEHRQQALVYDIYVRNCLDLPATEVVEVRFYHLGTGEVISHTFTEEERTEKLWVLSEQFGELQRLSDDPRINTAPENRFPPRVSWACLGCNHRLMCEAFESSKLSTARKAGMS